MDKITIDFLSAAVFLVKQQQFKEAGGIQLGTTNG